MLFRIKKARNVTPIYSENKFRKCTIGTTQPARQRYKQALIPNVRHNQVSPNKSGSKQRVPPAIAIADHT